jgi:hypothetical protein
MCDRRGEFDEDTGEGCWIREIWWGSQVDVLKLDNTKRFERQRVFRVGYWGNKVYETSMVRNACNS